jgi:hypothetical protein
MALSRMNVIRPKLNALERTKMGAKRMVTWDKENFSLYFAPHSKVYILILDKFVPSTPLRVIIPQRTQRTKSGASLHNTVSRYSY